MANKDIFNASSVLSKYGLKSSLLSRDKEEDELSKIQDSISNYQTRIGTAGVEIPVKEDKTNLFLKALKLWDMPTRGVMNSIGGVVNNDREDNLIENFKKGWSGEERYEGTDLMRDSFGEAESKIGKFGQGVGGFVTEALVDPTNLLTLGAGSLAKGLLTGTAKTLTNEAAEGIAKGLLKKTLVNASDDVVESSIKKLTKELMDKAATEGTESALELAAKEAVKFTVPDFAENMAKDYTRKNANEVLTKYGLKNIDEAANLSKDAMLKDSTGAISSTLLQGDRALQGKGLSIAGKTIGNLTNSRLQDIGAGASDLIKSKVPVVGKGLEKVQNKLNSLFDSNYIDGMDTTGKQIMRFFKKDALGGKNVADVALKETTKNFSDSLTALGVKTGREQDELIIRYIEGLTPADQLDKATLAVAEKMKTDLADWGMEEMDADTLKNMLNGYFPHTTNWKYSETYKGRTQLGGINKKLGVTNTSAFKRDFPNIDEGNLAMKFMTSSQETQANFVDHLVRESTEESIEAFEAALAKNATPGMSMKKLSAYKEGITDYSDLDGISDFFETSAVKSYISRGLKHNKVIADKDFLDSVKAAFGTKIQGSAAVMDARRKGLDVIIDKQSVSMFLGTNNEGRIMNKASKIFGEGKSAVGGKFTDDIAQGLSDKLGDNFEIEKLPEGVRQLLERITDSSAPTLSKLTNDEYMLLATVFPVEAYAVPHGAVNAINQYAGKQIDTGISAIGDMVDWMHNKWKPTVTGLRPDYHIRNLVGSSEQNVRNLGFKALDPALNIKATKIAQGTKNGALDLGGQRFSYDEIREAMVKTHANSTFMRTDPTFLAEELGSELIGTIGKKKGVFARANKVGRAVGNTIEDEVRTINFIANVEIAIEKGLGKEQAFKYAGDMVAQYHFDYSDLTKFEKDVVKRVMPFYTFAKKNLGLQMEQFLNDPTFYNELPRFNRNMNNAFGVDDSNQPEWFAQGNPLSLPFLQSDQQKKDGKTPYANISLPSSDINNYGEPLSQLIGMLSPLIKTPIELHTGSKLFNNAPISRYEGEKVEILPGVELNAELVHVLSQFGIIRDVSKVTAAGEPSQSSVTPLNDSAVASVLNTLRAYDPGKAEIEGAYDYQRQLGNEVQRLKETGTNILDVDDIKFIQENYPEYRDMIQKLGYIPEVLKVNLKNKKKLAPKEQTVKFR